MADEEFDNIIKENDLENFQGGLSISQTTIKDMHEGISSLGEMIMYTVDFIHDYYMAVATNAELEDRPSLDEESVQLLNIVFDNAERFCAKIRNVFELDDDEEEDKES